MYIIFLTDRWYFWWKCDNVLDLCFLYYWWIHSHSIVNDVKNKWCASVIRKMYSLLLVDKLTAPNLLISLYKFLTEPYLFSLLIYWNSKIYKSKIPWLNQINLAIGWAKYLIGLFFMFLIGDRSFHSISF